MKYPSIITLVLLTPLISATPLVPRATIPGPPADPPQPAGDGSGEYNTEWLCKPNDWKVEGLLSAGVIAFDAKGWHAAARCMNHYLIDVGTDLDVNLANMMQDVPAFRDALHDLAQAEAKKAVDFIGPWVTRSFTSKWTVWHAWNDAKNEAHSWDWYYALGEYLYSVTGVVTNGADGKMTLEWQAFVFDRYNWDQSGKKQNLGWGIEISHKEIGHLHVCGAAREYNVRGKSKVQTVKGYNPKKPLPAVDTSGSQWWGWQSVKSKE